MAEYQPFYLAKKSFFHSGYGSSPQSGASNINALDARVLAFSRTSLSLERFLARILNIF